LWKIEPDASEQRGFGVMSFHPESEWDGIRIQPDPNPGQEVPQQDPVGDREKLLAVAEDVVREYEIDAPDSGPGDGKEDNRTQKTQGETR